MAKTWLSGAWFWRTKRGSAAIAAGGSEASQPLAIAPTERAFAVLVWTIFALTFLKGFRFPSLWCATHFTFNYSQGFVRRGLVGEVLRQLGGNDVYKYNLFVALSFAILAAVGLLLTLAIRRVLRERQGNWTFRVGLLVACASPGMVFFVHAVGYFDLLGLLFVLALLLWAPSAPGRFPVFYALAAGGLVLPLIHEGLLVMFGPAALFIGLCKWIRALDGRQPTRREFCLLGAHAVGAVALICAVTVTVSSPTSLSTMQALQRFARQHADFGLRPDAFQVLTQTTRNNVTVVVPSFWAAQSSRVTGVRGLIAFLPGFSFLAYCTVRSIVASALQKPLRAALVISFLAASLAPEVMNFVGWDWQRWNSMALMSCLTCVVAYPLHLAKARDARGSLGLVTIGLLLTAIGLASTAPLFDEYKVQYFPFDQQFEFMGRVLDGHFKYRPSQ
jgi:hypothetical protein